VVELLGGSTNGGFDIIAIRTDGLGKFLCLVECKHFVNRKVGIKVVSSLHGYVQKERANAGAIFTTATFSTPAIKYASQTGHVMPLVDYDRIKEGLEKFKKS
jgi:restriction endonuclease Mrr